MQSASIETIFADALKIADGQPRRDYLDRACAGDAALRREVDELLDADGVSGSKNFMSNPAARTSDLQYDTGASGAYDSAAGALTGSQIGSYKLVKFLGEGSISNAFLAEQSQPVQRRSVLKILRMEHDAERVLTRFDGERPTLARLDDPHIAKSFDAGITLDGRAYFVIEWVDGVPITAHCESNQLPLRERLQLFLQACRAVQHAHEKGVLHLDIKPSNVVAAMRDGAPFVKVLDFGVANAVNRTLTDLGTSFGVLEYLSPEQVIPNAGVDVRNDVYALGVMLYELLTGVTPLGHANVSEIGFKELLRLVREEVPPAPSTYIAEPAMPRRSPAVVQAAEVREDLDWIVMRALEKDRAGRYATVADFARDVERHLNDEPVEAAPPSTVYRLRKFAKRNLGWK